MIYAVDISTDQSSVEKSTHEFEKIKKFVTNHLKLLPFDESKVYVTILISGEEIQHVEGENVQNSISKFQASSIGNSETKSKYFFDKISEISEKNIFPRSFNTLLVLFQKGEKSTEEKNIIVEQLKELKGRDFATVLYLFGDVAENVSQAYKDHVTNVVVDTNAKDIYYLLPIISLVIKNLKGNSCFIFSLLYITISQTVSYLANHD